MARGDRRGNREAKKPKQPKAPVTAVSTSHIVVPKRPPNVGLPKRSS